MNHNAWKIKQKQKSRYQEIVQCINREYKVHNMYAYKQEKHFLWKLLVISEIILEVREFLIAILGLERVCFYIFWALAS